METDPGPLTPRQLEILKLVCLDKNNREIAELLRVSIKTVDKHRGNLLVKLKIHTSVGLVIAAFARGLVKVPTVEELSETANPGAG